MKLNQKQKQAEKIAFKFMSNLAQLCDGLPLVTFKKCCKKCPVAWVALKNKKPADMAVMFNLN